MGTRDFSNLIQMFDHSVNSFPKRVAIVFGSKKITFFQLKEYSGKVCEFLRKKGIKSGDKVCLWLHNCPEFVFSYFAILRLGAIVVPVNSMFKREEAKFIIEDCSAKALICSIDKLEDSKNILLRVDNLKDIVCLPYYNKDAIKSFNYILENNDCFDGICSSAKDDIAQILYTSGTTGRPKGACLTHGNLLANVKDSSCAIRVRKKDVFICILPLFHSFALTVCMLLPIYEGAKIVIMRTIRPFKRVMRAVLKNRVTVFTGVPSLYNILSEAKFSWSKLFMVRIFNPVRLYISGAAALSKETLKKFENKFKRPLIEGYGLTESSPVVSLNPINGPRKAGSVGKPYDSLEIKIIDKSGNELKLGQVGELIIKGPSVMKGYYRLDQETRKTIKNGWLYTGDLAKLDEDGYIYIVDRAKDMINVRGLNVYPKEIEEVLYRHPQVKEASVVGVCHSHKGEVGVAFVVKLDDISERELIKYLRENIASYKVPLKVIFKQSLPKNTIGKILKRELKKEIENIFKR